MLHKASGHQGAVCLTPDGGSTVHMLWSVFEQTMPSVVILDVVERDGLEAPPAKREDEGVSCLQDAAVPAVFLQPHLAHKTHTHTQI